MPKERALPITGLCGGGTSYSYILHQVGQDEYAFLASSLEIQPTANLGRADYLTNSGRALELFASPKDGIQMDWGQAIHYIGMK